LLFLSLKGALRFSINDPHNLMERCFIFTKAFSPTYLQFISLGELLSIKISQVINSPIFFSNPHSLHHRSLNQLFYLSRTTFEVFALGFVSNLFIFHLFKLHLTFSFFSSRSFSLLHLDPIVTSKITISENSSMILVPFSDTYSLFSTLIVEFRRRSDVL